MAAPKNKTESKTSKQAPKPEGRELSYTQRWALGLVLLFISLFILASVVSYYFTWADDQDAVRWGRIWSERDLEVGNLMGKLGAVVSDFIVGYCFGAFGIAIPVVLIILAVRIMRQMPMFLRRAVRMSLIVMVLGSLSLGLLFGERWGVFGSGLGGAQGIFVTEWLVSYIGTMGLGLGLLLSWVLLAVYVNRNTIRVVNKVGKGIVEGGVMVGEAVGRGITSVGSTVGAKLQRQESARSGEDAEEPAEGEAVTQDAAEIEQTAHNDNIAPERNAGDIPEASQEAVKPDPDFEITYTRDDREDNGTRAAFAAEGVDVETGDDYSAVVTLGADVPVLHAPWLIHQQPETDKHPFEVIDLTDAVNRAMDGVPDDPDEHPEAVGPDEEAGREGVSLGIGGVAVSDGRSAGMQVLVPENRDAQLDDDDISDMLYDPTLELSSYHRPPVEILEDHSVEVKVTEAEVYENKNRIIETLGNFGIKIDRIKATIGPTVTLYEIVPAPGIRISKIKNLEDDIALSLSALGIRIIAPMPGKGTIGIEVPNKDKEVVSMYSVIKSIKFQESTYDLPIVLGKTIQNETFIVDLAKMPHLLVAGATGQGKSVGLNAIIASLLYKKHPAELKFVLVDPKKVELTLYQKLERHFLAKMPGEDEAIITDTHKVIYTLNSLCIEMDQRYDLMRKAEVRNVKEYNDKFTKRRLNPRKGHRFMPYIVVVIDEFADMIMTAGREIETPIARLAQLARAVGIHLVIATQRPTTNIITGVIKANFPARIAFRVSSMIDSRTIIDQPGANQLIGRGDMLISNGNDLVRVQCAFLDTPEVERVTEFIGSQRGYSDAYELPEYSPEGDSSGSKSADLGKVDDMFGEVARFIVQHQQGSTSAIQRRFSIGYNRAGRLMDQIEAAGIVGRAEGSKPREVLISDMHSLEMLLDSMGV